MIVTFCGHGDCLEPFKCHDQLMELLEETVGDQACDFYLGGLESFDHFARRCCAEYQKKHPHTALFLIIPIVGQVQIPSPLIMERYDAILYPNIEALPFADALSRCNRWMVERADIVIMNINSDCVSENEIYQFAVKKKKLIYNLSPKEPDQ